MAKKYIDAELLKDNLRAACLPVDEKGISGMLGDDKSIADYIDDEPAADVQEVRRGKWSKENTEYGVRVECSECKFEYPDSDFYYCPCCGARMDGENND